MGVHFYPCDHCNRTFPDCGSYLSCVECGRKWCDDNCASHCNLAKSDYNQEGTRYEILDWDDERWDEAEYVCSHCRIETASDSELFAFALKKLGVTREALEIEYIDQK